MRFFEMFQDKQFFILCITLVYRIDMGEIIDKVREKAKVAKYKIVDITNSVTGKTQDTVSP